MDPSSEFPGPKRQKFIGVDRKPAFEPSPQGLRVLPREYLSLDQVLAKEQMGVTDIDQRVADFAKMIAVTPGGPEGDKTYEKIDSIYHLYRHREDPRLQGTQFAQIDSFDAFISTYIPDIDFSTRKTVLGKFSHFIQYYIHESRIINGGLMNLFRLMREPNTVHVYHAEGTWLPIREWGRSSSEIPSVIDKVILDDVQSLRDFNTGKPYEQRYFHQTSSAAFPEIINNNAILSAAEQHRRGEKPKSGAYISEITEEVKHIARDAVYAYRHNPRIDAYGALSWFDEYAISFEINHNKQQAFLEQLKQSRKIHPSQYGLDTEAASGFGEMLGPEVPLSSVDVVYCWAKHKQEVIDALKARGEDTAHIKVFALEAAVVLADHRYNVDELLAGQQK